MKPIFNTLIFFFILFNFQTNSLGAQQSAFQSPYTLSWGLDAPLLGAGLGLNTVYLILDHKSKPLTDIQINALMREDIWAIDRSAAYNWSKPAARASDVLMFTTMAAPSALLIDPKIRQDFGKFATVWAGTFLLNVGVTNMTKVLVKRTRPYVYNPNTPLELKHERDSRYSFFSGHTSVTASMSFMTAKIFNDYNPGHPALPYVWTAAAVLPAGAAFLRWRAGKHFPTDVIVGYVVGAAIGFIVPHLHKLGN